MALPARIASAIAVLLTALRPASALDPAVRLSQYAHTAWRIQDGSFNSAPNVITQTADGYIWVGTGTGLVMFDGVRFVSPQFPPGQNLHDSAIYGLLGASDGTLWIGTATGLARWKNNAVSNMIAGRINQVLEDREGGIWVARSRTPDTKGGLCQVAGAGLQCFGGSSSMNLPYAGPLAQDTEGNIWAGGSDELMRWNTASYRIYFREELKAFKGLASVESVVAAEDGSVWAAVAQKGIGIQRIIGGAPRRVEFAGLDGSKVSVLFFDRNRCLWIGTFEDGIFRFDGRRLDHFRREDGLSANAVRAFFEDREGGLWVATSKGIDYFRDNQVVTFSVTEGLTTDLASSVLVSRDGAVWIGNHEALDCLRDGRVTSIRQEDGLPGKRVTTLFEDHAGRLWVGVDNMLTIYERGRFRRLTRPDGSPIGVVIAMTQDRDENIWLSVIGNGREIVRIRDFQLQEVFASDRIPSTRLLAADPTGGIWLGLGNGNLDHYRDGKLDNVAIPQRATPSTSVSAILPNLDGSVWVATGSGVYLWTSAGMRALSSKNGLPCEDVAAAIRDRDGGIWLYTTCGLIAIGHSELDRWRKRSDSVLRMRVFDAFDGAQGARSSFQPAASRAPDGTLWFVNEAVVQTIDPARLHANRIPPPVQIQQVRADHKVYPAAPVLTFPPRTHDIEIDYTALSFLIPQKVKFRYKLDRADSDWHDASARRQAYYSNLAPGGYRFHVMASNNDGVWNETGAVFDFQLLPAYYQTLWFRCLAIGAALAALALLYHLRMRQLAGEMNTRFNERLAERTRLARELHDTLLQTIQGSKLLADVALDRDADSARMRSALERLSEWLGKAVEEGRSALNSLRTSTTQRNDLAESLERAGEECRLHQSIEFTLAVDGAVREMHPIARDEVYRIGYEAIRNAYTHSGCSRVEVGLDYRAGLILRIRDNGKGIEPGIAAEGKPGHFGVLGMYERAARLRGRLTVSSAPGFGTEVELIVPEAIIFQRTELAATRRLHRLKRLLRRER